MGRINRMVGREIKAVRKVLGLSQREVAVRSGLPRTYLSEVENGHVSVRFVAASRILNAMGIRFTDFLQMLADRLEVDGLE